MTITVGYVMHCGTTINHQSPTTNPDFPEGDPHDATCVKVENETAFMKCVCGNTWQIPQSDDGDERNLIKEEPPLKYYNKISEERRILDIPDDFFRNKKNDKL